VRLGNPQGRDESPANLPIGVAVLPENASREHQLCMKAVLVTQSSSSVYQCRKHDKLIGWVVMRARVYAVVGMGRFKVQYDPESQYLCRWREGGHFFSSSW
jgi:hypothetical protein